MSVALVFMFALVLLYAVDRVLDYKDKELSRVQDRIAEKQLEIDRLSEKIRALEENLTDLRYDYAKAVTKKK